MGRRCIVVLLGLTLSASVLHAQRGTGFSGLHGARSFAQRGGFTGPYRHHGFPGFYLGDSLLYGDNFYDEPPIEPPPPVRAVDTGASASVEPEVKHDPLLIEWQGDRYVRYEGAQQPATTAPTEYSQNAAGSAPATDAGRTAELPPAVLVYRDGHQEKVSDYSIISGVLYARGNYWRDGYWTRNVEISSLDIPATIEASHANGVKFALPAGPNEVVTRP